MCPRRRAFWLMVSAPAACLTAVVITAGGTAPAGAADQATKTITVGVADDASDANPPASTWGHVTSDPAGVDCPDVCSAAFPAGSALQLTVQHEAGDYAFVGWSVFGNEAGTDCDTAETCSLTLADDTEDVTVEARLKPATQLWAIPEG